jgi:hypothetical protein
LVGADECSNTPYSNPEGIVGEGAPVKYENRGFDRKIGKKVCVFEGEQLLQRISFSCWYLLKRTYLCDPDNTGLIE